MYQCRPQPADGGLFQAVLVPVLAARDGDLFGCDAGRGLSPGNTAGFFLTVDLAFSLKKEADYTVIAAWAVTPSQDLILMDLQRERLEGPDMSAQISGCTARTMPSTSESKRCRPRPWSSRLPDRPA